MVFDDQFEPKQGGQFETKWMVKLYWNKVVNLTVFSIVPNNWADDDMYLDLIGTKYMRKENYHEALAVFQKMNPNFWEKNYAYADYLPTFNICDLTSYAPWEERTFTPYKTVSKALIVKDIVAIVDKINNKSTSTELKAYQYYLLGCAKENMTYNGHFWMMISYGNFINETINEKGNYHTYSFYPNSLVYGDKYYKGSSAKAAFQQAIRLGKNKELIAKAQLGIKLVHRLAHGQSPADDIILNENTRAYQLARVSCPDIQ